MDWLIDAHVPTHTPIATIVIRLCVAALLGAVIGLEREWRARPAGLRTHMLTALAAAVFTVLMAEMVHADLFTRAGIQADPTRLIEAVTAGVAFLAAGTIIRGSQGVEGLTTGAAMWLAGSIGVAAGLGQFAVGGIAAFLGLIIIAGLGAAESAAQKK